jgi:hypothetical protein
LTATQLQESAVYLSLKYIAILLQSNPSIEGAEGSEYRLFIVALMLGKHLLKKSVSTLLTFSVSQQISRRQHFHKQNLV